MQLRETYVSTPKSPQEWKRISEEFSSVWNFPHCIGAGYGKHVVIDCSENTGSNFFNDKGAFSIVLLAYGDANHCFTAVDVGQYVVAMILAHLLTLRLAKPLRVTESMSQKLNTCKGVLTNYHTSLWLMKVCH